MNPYEDFVQENTTAVLKEVFEIKKANALKNCTSALKLMMLILLPQGQL